VKLTRKKNDQSVIHRLTKPVNIEVWDYDMIGGHDILGSLKIDLYDTLNYHRLKKFENNELKQINQYKNRINNGEVLSRDEEYDYDILQMRKETEYIKKVYTKIDAVKDHFEYKPYKYSIKD